MKEIKNYIEGCLNDFENGEASKEETTKNLYDVINFSQEELKKQRLEKELNNSYEARKNRIIKIVERQTGFSFLKIYSPERTKQLSFARMALSYFLQKNMNLSLSAISKIMNRNHATIKYQIGRIEHLINPKFNYPEQKLLFSIKNEIEGSFRDERNR